jgi:hypothetical protein
MIPESSDHSPQPRAACVRGDGVNLESAHRPGSSRATEVKKSVKPAQSEDRQHESPKVASSQAAPEAVPGGIRSTKSKNATDRFSRQPCGLISDSSTNLQWYIGLDVNMTWPAATKWAKSLTACGGNWSMPKLAELKSLFESNYQAGTGYFLHGKHWPAHLHPIFSGIGGGSWVWLDGQITSQGAPAFNFNQGQEVRYSATEPEFPTRAFSVRRVK